ncbi:hypothetical protein RchiOBHm_Chr3g0469701 [Rosa chinensis]|uniref:Uncharacterized protein n=1 Tax=Rosa chinensis TaxID=74649 RepID=A0A2P6RAV4_ROSCH|nr:hypothetical protein RchiOBHm_Chr3g0469701 [Rosa chinensis]
MELSEWTPPNSAIHVPLGVKVCKSCLPPCLPTKLQSVQETKAQCVGKISEFQVRDSHNYAPPLLEK